MDPSSSDLAPSPRELVGDAAATLGRGVTQPRVLSFGPRAFRVALDGLLSPIMFDEDGARIDALPRPRKSDDAAVVTHARQQLKQLRAELGLVAPVALALLEEDLVQGRQWPSAQFETWLHADEVFRHLAQQLLWGRWSESGTLVSSALVEEGVLRPIASPEASAKSIDGNVRTADRVGLLHPVELADDVLSYLREVAATRELQPVFAQLERDVFRPTPEELRAGAAQRFAGARLRLRRPLLRGWRNGPVGEDALLTWIERRFECGITAELHHSGVDWGDAPPSSVKLETLRFRGAAGHVALSEVPARCFSEAVRDAMEFASGA